jgi:hypothetical protein
MQERFRKVLTEGNVLRCGDLPTSRLAITHSGLRSHWSRVLYVCRLKSSVAVFVRHREKLTTYDDVDGYVSGVEPRVGEVHASS